MNKVCKIELRNLRIKFPLMEKKSVSGLSANYVTAADNISLKILSGDKVGIIGRNGSGKSTLLSVIAGNVIPDSGVVSIHGERLALINRSSGLEQNATVTENAILRGFAHKLNSTELDQFVDKVIQTSGLGDRRNSALRVLSTGMLGRFNIALNSQVVKPITILDEWIGTLNMDADGSNSLVDKLSNEAEIIVLASHNQSLIRQVCNRVILLEQGTVIYDGACLDGGYEKLDQINRLDPKQNLSITDLVQKIEAEELFARKLKGEKESLLNSRKKLRHLFDRFSVQYRKSLSRIHFALEQKVKEDERINLIKEYELQKHKDQQLYLAKCKAEKQVIHFMNIGRTLMPIIQEHLQSQDSENFEFRFHNNLTRLRQIPEGNSLGLVIRPPIERLYSAFYARKLQGQPHAYFPWTELEKKTFQHFSEANELILSLNSEDVSSRDMALMVFRENQFFNTSYNWYFDDLGYIASRSADFRFVFNAGDLSSMSVRLEDDLGLKLGKYLTSYEVPIFKSAQPLSDSAKKVFDRVFEYENKIYESLSKLVIQ